MKQLFLTVEQRVLNDAAQKKLDDFEASDDYEEPRDSSGRSREDYESLAMRPSKELEELEKKVVNTLRFDAEKDYDYFETPCMIRLSDYSACIDDVEGGSTIYLHNNLKIEVLEDSDDVAAQIWYHSRGWWEVMLEKAEQKIKSIFNK